MSSVQSKRKPAGVKLSGGTLLLAAAVIFLLAGILGVGNARNALPRAGLNLAKSETALSDAHIREHLAQQNKILLGTANALQEHAQNLGVLPQAWGERQVNLRMQHLMREQINQLMLTTSQAKGQVFQPDEFELSVTKTDEGLFQMPEIAAQPVLLTLRGTVHFRLSEGSL